MIKVFFTFAFLLSSAAAIASSNWIVIGKANDVTFSIDTNSQQKSGDSVTFWTMRNYAQRRNDGMLSTRDQLTINCRTRDSTFKYMQTFDDNNNNGKIISTYQADAKWQPIAPDSIMWSYYEFVCKK
jgi:hypothetical protein